MSHKVILALGIENLFADGFSMAASSYAGVEAEQEEIERIKLIEEQHVRDSPLHEKEEVRQLLEEQGLHGSSKESALKAITAEKDRWVKFMLMHEYGLSKVRTNAYKAETATFAAFVICGSVPIIPFFLPLTNPEYFSFGATGFVFFGIGALKMPMVSKAVVAQRPRDTVYRRFCSKCCL